MKPHKHAILSARRYGGDEAVHLQVHNFFDQTKACYPGQSHRLILHNDFGIELAARIFGEAYRQAAEDHVIEDVGEVPTWQDCWNRVHQPTRVKRIVSHTLPVRPEVEEIMEHPLLHHSLGPFIVEQLLGPRFRADAENYLLRKFGVIPPLYELLVGVRPPAARPGRGMRRIKERVSTTPQPA